MSPVPMAGILLLTQFLLRAAVGAVEREACLAGPVLLAGPVAGLDLEIRPVVLAHQGRVAMADRCQTATRVRTAARAVEAVHQSEVMVLLAETGERDHRHP